jgi:hypothetical protein
MIAVPNTPWFARMLLRQMEPNPGRRDEFAASPMRISQQSPVKRIAAFVSAVARQPREVDQRLPHESQRLSAR